MELPVKKLLLGHALEKIAGDRARFQYVQIGDLPLYDQDFDAQYPAQGTRLKDQVRAADAVLFVTPESSPVLVKSCRNLPGVQIRTAATMATYDVVAADVVVLTRKAVEALAQSRGTSGEAE